MISRRSLLTGFSLLPLTGGIVGCAARASALAAGPAAGGAIPLVGPGTRWNGSPLSGGVPPADPVRTTAKPAILWLVPSDLRLVSNLTIGVDADANGGVKQVDFWVEGQVQTVTAPSIYTDTDANGAQRSRYGYWITLNASAFKTVSTTGEARLYATAVPTNATMQSRVIGYDAVSVSDGNYPMHVFPRALANDWSKTVRLDGAGDFTSIAAAITAARAAAAEAPLISIAQTGFYEVTNNAGGSPVNFAAGKGFCTVTASTGVTATLGRAAAFTPNSPPSWTWTPGWDGIEFRGAGIVFDQRNWSQMSFSAKPAWYNGCKFTNSIGTRDSYYWNGGTPYTTGAGDSQQAGPAFASYWDGVSLEYIAGCLQQQRYVQNCAMRSTVGDVFSGTNYVQGNYVRDWDGVAFQPPVNAISITYTDPGGHSSATVTKTGSDGITSTIVLAVNGTTTHTITLGKYNGDPNMSIADVAATINGFGDGWRATVLARGAMRASALGGENGGGNPTSANAYGVAVLIVSAFGIHADWWQGYNGSAGRQNVIIRNNTCRADNTADNNSFLFNDDNDNGGFSYDHILKGNVWVSSATAACPNNYFGGNKTSHYVFENNTMQGRIGRREYINGNPATGPDVGDATYSSYKNNLVETVVPYGWTSGTYFPNSPPWINNAYTQSNINGSNVVTLNGRSDSGNYNYFGATTFRTLFKDYANGDFRPAASGILTHLMPKVNTYAGLQASAANDVPGALLATGSAPTWPF
jgi:hypothetical protein